MPLVTLSAAGDRRGARYHATGAPCGPFGAAMERVVSHRGRQEAV